VTTNDIIQNWNRIMRLHLFMVLAGLLVLAGCPTTSTDDDDAVADDDDAVGDDDDSVADDDDSVADDDDSVADDDDSVADDDDSVADDDDSVGDDDDSVGDDDDSVGDDDDSVGDDDDSVGDDDDSTAVDADGDGVDATADCDDNDPNNYPGNTEVCDGQDNDCANGPDADAAGEVDGDSDGSLSCVDCDDADGANYPGNTEVCDGQDNDCVNGADAAGGEVDGDSDGSLSCADCDDADGANYPGNTEVCDGQDNDCVNGADADPAGEVDGDSDGSLSCADCDDADGSNFPGNTELCDGQDNDCANGADAAGGEVDNDSDGSLSCADCDDGDGANFPGNAEICDGQDNDCDGLTPATETDDDSDGFAECENDCDDTNPAVGPTAAEICDGLDNDCDTVVPLDETDDDSDGTAECDGDCDDTDPGIGPTAVEVCDGADTNCDGDFLSGRWEGDPLTDTLDIGNTFRGGKILPSTDFELVTFDYWFNASAGQTVTFQVFSSGTLNGTYTQVTSAPSVIAAGDAGQAQWHTSPALNLDLVAGTYYALGVHFTDTTEFGATTTGSLPFTLPVTFPGGTYEAGLFYNGSTPLTSTSNTSGYYYPLSLEIGGELDEDMDGAALCGDDCDDLDPDNFFGNPEICDGGDNDCDGLQLDPGTWEPPPAENGGDFTNAFRGSKFLPTSNVEVSEYGMWVKATAGTTLTWQVFSSSTQDGQYTQIASTTTTVSAADAGRFQWQTTGSFPISMTAGTYYALGVHGTSFDTAFQSASQVNYPFDMPGGTLVAGAFYNNEPTPLSSMQNTSGSYYPVRLYYPEEYDYDGDGAGCDDDCNDNDATVQTGCAFQAPCLHPTASDLAGADPAGATDIAFDPQTCEAFVPSTVSGTDAVHAIDFLGDATQMDGFSNLNIASIAVDPLEAGTFFVSHNNNSASHGLGASAQYADVTSIASGVTSSSSLWTNAFLNNGQSSIAMDSSGCIWTPNFNGTGSLSCVDQLGVSTTLLTGLAGRPESVALDSNEDVYISIGNVVYSVDIATATTSPYVVASGDVLDMAFDLTTDDLYVETAVGEIQLVPGDGVTPPSVFQTVTGQGKLAVSPDRWLVRIIPDPTNSATWEEWAL